TSLGPERRVDLHFVRPKGLCAIRHQSPHGAQQEAYRRRECGGESPVTRGAHRVLRSPPPQRQHFSRYNLEHRFRIACFTSRDRAVCMLRSYSRTRSSSKLWSSCCTPYCLTSPMANSQICDRGWAACWVISRSSRARPNSSSRSLTTSVMPSVSSRNRSRGE